MSWTDAERSGVWVCKVFPDMTEVNIASAFDPVNFTHKIPYHVQVYDRNADGIWELSHVDHNSFRLFLFEGKLYCLLPDHFRNTLIPLNMNFHSRICSRCYKVVLRDDETAAGDGGGRK